MMAVAIRQGLLHRHGDLRHCARPSLHAIPERVRNDFEEPIPLPWRERRCGGSQRSEFLVIEADGRQMPFLEGGCPQKFRRSFIRFGLADVP
jgi:hypothetical protein